MKSKTFNVTGEAIFPHLTQPNRKFDTDGVYEVYVRVSQAELDTLLEKMRDNINELARSVIAEKKLPADIKVTVFPWQPSKDRDKNVIPNSIDLKIKHRAVIGKGQARMNWTLPLFGPDCQPFDTSAVIGMGSKLRVAFRCYIYYLSGRLGLSLQLVGVQVLDLKVGSRSAEACGFTPSITQVHSVYAKPAEDIEVPPLENLTDQFASFLKR